MSRFSMEQIPMSILILIVVGLVLLFFGLLLLSGHSEVACLATVDQVTPNFMKNFNTIAGYEVRPLQVLCRTLLN